MPPLSDCKIPIITNVNDVPSQQGDAKHPNASLLCSKYNALIDDLTAYNTDNIVEGTGNKYYTDARARASISVTGNASYNPSTGVITVQGAQTIDHIELTNTNGLEKTYSIWADANETINLGTFTVSDGQNGINGTNGTNGVNGIGIDHISLTSTNGLNKTYTAWGNVLETINLGTFTIADGSQGLQGLQGVQGVQGVQGTPGQGYTFRGTYNNSTAYSPYDNVVYNGNSYVCILASTGNLPTNATYWTLFASKGDTGGATLGTPQTYTFTATNLVNDGVAVGTIPTLPSAFIAYKVESNYPVRIRLYLNADYESADRNRANNVEIQGDHGCYFDATTTVEKNLIRNLAPPPVALGKTISMTNLSGTTQSSITVTITALTLEA